MAQLGPLAIGEEIAGDDDLAGRGRGSTVPTLGSGFKRSMASR